MGEFLQYVVKTGIDASKKNPQPVFTVPRVLKALISEYKSVQ